VKDFGSDEEGAKLEKAVLNRKKHAQKAEQTRTVVYSSYVLEWREQEHEHNSHAKNLNATSRHV
jgi:hypothetical protein